MQPEPQEHADAPQGPSVAPREPGSPLSRKRSGRTPKLVWPLSLGVAALLIYGMFSGTDNAKNARSDDAAIEELRPAPRAVRPVQEAPVFVPVQVASAPAAAVPPLPPGMPLPAVDEPALAAQRQEAARTAAEERLRRRMAPLLISVSSGEGQSPARAQDPGAGVVQDAEPRSRRDRSGASSPGRAAEAAAPAPDFLDQTNASEAKFQPAVLQDADPSLEMKILQGKTIGAVLETPIHTDHQGSVRAMVDEDVYGEAGRVVVIPRMSRLVGEFQKDVKAGQTRVLVVWRRAILPDGKSLQLMSYGTDGLGRSGMAGEVDTHFLERFGAAFLVSMMGVAVDSASQQNMPTGNGGVVIWGNESREQALKGLNSTIESMLKSQSNIPPTIQIAQGSRVRVFVARDLDLSIAPKPGR